MMSNDFSPANRFARGCYPYLTMRGSSDESPPSAEPPKKKSRWLNALMLAPWIFSVVMTFVAYQQHERVWEVRMDRETYVNFSHRVVDQRDDLARRLAKSERQYTDLVRSKDRIARDNSFLQVAQQKLYEAHLAQSRKLLETEFDLMDEKSKAEMYETLWKKHARTVLLDPTHTAKR